MREDVFRRKVVKRAHQLGWKVTYFHRLPTRGQEWRTPVGGDGAGWPDLILVRDRIVFVELKGEKGRLSPEQKAWLDRLRAAGGEAYVWKPQDWDAIELILDDGSDLQLRLTNASRGDVEHAKGVMRMIR